MPVRSPSFFRGPQNIILAAMNRSLLANLVEAKFQDQRLCKHIRKEWTKHHDHIVSGVDLSVIVWALGALSCWTQGLR